MKFVIVFTALLALATAAVLPTEKSDSLNELIPDTEYNGIENYEDIQEQEVHDSIADSFEPVVRVMSRYKSRDLTESSEMKNEISVPDTVVIGSRSDTYLTSVRVKGLKEIDSQNISMSWKEDLVHVENSWENLTINGVYHHVNKVRYSGVFEIVLVKPVYSGNTSLTKNANIYPAMSPASWVTFKKAVINHSKLPEVFQNEKPQFDNFINNVVRQYVATAVSTNMYNDITMKLRNVVKPYLKYRNEKIDATDAVTGKLSNGDKFEMKNIHMDVAKNNLAKIYDVQMNNTGNKNTAKLQLRLLDLAGECDWSVTDDSKTFGGKLKFTFDRVKIVSALNFVNNAVHTEVYVKSPQVDLKSEDSDNTDPKEQLTEELVKYFVQKLSESTSQKINNAM